MGTKRTNANPAPKATPGRKVGQDHPIGKGSGTDAARPWAPQSGDKGAPRVMPKLAANTDGDPNGVCG